jgi:hypothetical protein
MSFQEVPAKVDFPAQEREMLKFWEETQAFDRLRRIHEHDTHWSFIDGPITANNPMGVHHGWGRTYKYLIERFWTMRGHKLRYQNGFDCQGLWVEVEVEKELGLTPAPAEELVSRLVKEGRLVKVSEELYFGPAALARVGEVLGEHFGAEKSLEASAFRDKLGITRKYAIPLLEYCDRIRWTRRVADVRIAGPSLPAKQA